LADFSRVSRKYIHVGDHRSRLGPKTHFDGPLRHRSSSDVRQRIALSSRYAPCARVILGSGPTRRDDAVSPVAPRGRGTPSVQGVARIRRVPTTGPVSAGAVLVVIQLA